MPQSELDWSSVWRTAEQAVSLICNRGHRDWDDLVLAGVVGIWEMDDPSASKMLVARRRAIDEWRKIGKGKHQDFEVTSLDSLLSSDGGAIKQKVQGKLSCLDSYPHETESVQEVAERMATDEREATIFAILADGGSKRQAAEAIGRDPGRVSQILKSYRIRCS
jgi:hypothetical protein